MISPTVILGFKDEKVDVIYISIPDEDKMKIEYGNVDNVDFDKIETKFGLKQMVDDNISILKVGPALTFALREGLFALAHIENAWVDSSKQSHFIELLEEIMLENPSNWIKHYHGNEHELGIKRKYSFSDRSRYYMPDHRLEEAIKVLFENTKDVPYSLLSQFLPIQYRNS